MTGPMQRSSPPAFNLPASVTVLAVAMVLVHGLRSVLDPDTDFWIIAAFAFIPARYDPALSAAFPGGTSGDVWSFATYTLLHADWMHIIVNLVWMVAFGSAVARRFGTLRFVLLTVAASAGGAFAHLAAHWGETVPVVGASAAISGHMGAAVRFALAGPALLRPDAEGAREQLLRPAVPLLEALRERQVIAFLLVWFGVNFLFGVGTLALPGQSASVAWEAHIGGFLIGLLGFRLFDPVSARDGRPAHLP